jgi:endonuclease G
MKPLFLLLVYFLAFNVSAQAPQLVLGNPSDAVQDDTNPDNYLVFHNGFILSYNHSRGTPNWVTWHLSASDLGPIDRTNAFRADEALPIDWRIKNSDYSGSGYDRGHMCPSEDRSSTLEMNRETFLMSNMEPQLHRLNGGVWKSLEGYVQNLVRQNFEAYIIAGCYGEKGTLNDRNRVTIPTNCWKIVVVLPEGKNDLRRISRNTRVISVDMPNRLDIVGGWKNYRTTVDALEAVTGYDFLSRISDTTEAILEAKTDDLE